ncbi:unnamed protein product [Didymodactylos carnosus]|uniref:Uncharacterized protein n=1 Tax=Didymodactylos carnosus TaxID=1234261 RepID=A0A815ZIA3_9BILA|nr:unnamed protein product [Didymodactylos carnosus]CAF1585524.1 unnamed protein product [Didymodactylos carnosus]CAF4368807.1 unnamed protein product [Didymodactylos carnosus]CAF4454909.1 unnamed protein product [Didymodactylos carnosus]
MAVKKFINERLEERLTRLECLVDDQQRTIQDQQRTIQDQQRTIQDQQQTIHELVRSVGLVLNSQVQGLGQRMGTEMLANDTDLIESIRGNMGNQTAHVEILIPSTM